MHNWMIWGIIAIAAIAVTIVVIVVYKVTQEQEVERTSVLIKNLLDLNTRYNFDWSIRPQYIFNTVLPSKSKLERYDLIHTLDDSILNDGELTRVSKLIQNNKATYDEYSHKMHCLRSEVTSELAKELHISLDKYKAIERKLFTSKIVHPILDCQIVCVASYTSPQGRNHYEKNMVYTISDVDQRYKELQKIRESQNTEYWRRKHERSQMTDKLRYSILKRDGFRCKICGRTAEDGVKLHVDHIKPVSKGGETVPENLQTLCDACNLGKSNEW